MKHERMKVLELLEQGKITAEEATKLLEVMKHRDQEYHALDFDEETAQYMEDRLNRFTKHVDHFTKEFGGRVQSVYHEVEPKLKKASQAVLEKTAAIFDDISKSLNESLENARKSAEKGEECCCCCEAETEADDTPKEN